MNVFEYLRWAEDELMRLGNHAADTLVFNYLFRRIDAESGVVGKHQMISRARIASDVSEKGGRGTRKAPLVISDDNVDDSIRRMCKAGLLERLTVPHGNLLLRFVFPTENRTSPFSVQNEVPTKFRQSSDSKIVNNQGTYDTEKTAISPEVPTSLLPSIHPSIQQGEERFAMHSEWMPSEAFKKNVATMVSVTPELRLAMNVKVLEYKMFWSLPAQQRTKRTQSEWELHLLRNDIQRVIKGEVVKQAPTTMQTARKLLTVPRLEGEALQAWALRHGLPAANSGEESPQYLGRLRVLVERRNDGVNHQGVH